MKKFLIGALTAFMLMSFGAFTEAAQVDSENYCEQNRGDYCGRNGCYREQNRGDYCDKNGCEQNN